MNRRQLMMGTAALGGSLATQWPTPSQARAASAGQISASPREVLSLNAGWRFHDGDIAFPKVTGHGWTYANAKAGNAQGAASTEYDDSEWQDGIRLPHDFVIAQPLTRDANPSQGYRPRGIVWYRNLLRFEEADRGKHIEIQFEGIGTQATIWFNGTLIDHNWSGYNSIYLDVTPFVTYGGHLNSLVVRDDADQMQGWWYEGGGIYRDAWVVKRSATHIVTDGVFAHPIRTTDGWEVPVEVTLSTIAKSDQTITVTTDLLDADGRVVVSAQGNAVVKALQTAVLPLTLTCALPHLWTLETPYLYSVATRVVEDGRILDEVVTTCGFRTQRFDADHGFFLNDRHVKLQGVCLHQDHAGVGVAVPAALWDYRLTRLKTLGCNAIRCAHNAPAREFLDACDRLGFLVMDENRVFNPAPEHMAELQWMVRRDRNHPSVILWSVFNEEPMQGTEAGYEMVRRMREAVRELDMSRPVTGAMNDGLTAPVNVSQTLDVIGFNYQQDAYDAFHKANPHIPMTSSEDTSSYSIRGEYATDEARHIKGGFDTTAAEWGETHRGAWKAIAERDYIAGGFVWTGFDYRGEPTPYVWPTNSSLMGILDTCGFEKVPAFIHQAQWVKTRPVVNIAIHWTWPGREGQSIKVMVCANTEEVELSLNGKRIGRQRVDPFEMNFFDVPYAPGRLQAVGITGGKTVATTLCETAGKAVALRLTPFKPTLLGDGVDAMPVNVEAIDDHGRVVPDAAHMVVFTSDTVEILGVGNGDPNCLEPDKASQRSLFHGMAQVIIQSKPESVGMATLTAAAEGLKPGKATVSLEARPAPPLQVTEAPVQTLENWFRAPFADTAPDPTSRPGAGDNNSWQWFRAGTLLPAAGRTGFSLCAVSFTPFARGQRKGGQVNFFGIRGRAKIYIDGQLAGSKSDDTAGPLSVVLPAGTGERRLVVIFEATPEAPFGFSDVIQVASN